MSRYPAIAVLALVTVLWQSSTFGAQKRERQRAYKPAERRQAEEQPARAADAAPAAGSTYEQEVQAAKEKRDKDLEAAAAEETNRRKLEERKAQIFSQYAAIVAALRDKYEASGGDMTPQKGKPAPRTKAGRQKVAQAEQQPPTPAKPGGKAKKPKNDPGSLADAQQKLDEENARHQKRLDELNAQLQQAESSDNKRDVRRLQKAIEKENNTYNARKLILERRVKDLGGTPGAANGPSGKSSPSP